MAMVDRRFRQQINTGPTQGGEDRQGMFGRALSGITGAVNMMAAKRRAKRSGAVEAAELEDQRADNFIKYGAVQGPEEPEEGGFADARTLAKTIDVSDPNQVMAFQQEFNNMGGNLKLDGQFGPNTLAALKEVQNQGFNSRTEAMASTVDESGPVDEQVISEDGARYGSRGEVASRNIKPKSLREMLGLPGPGFVYNQGGRGGRRNR